MHPVIKRSFPLILKVALCMPLSYGAGQYAWSGNAGWIDLAPSAETQVSAAPGVLQGYAHAPNFGWIHFGDGSPADGKLYSNTSNTDFGVNHNGTGELSGYAYSANIGWINFGWASPTDPNRPRVDLINGAASGYAYSGNIGWINLNDLTIPGARTELFTSNDGDTVNAGSDINLQLRLFAEETLEFAWLRDGAVLPDITGPNLNLLSAQLFHAGNYQVRITRADGSTYEVDAFELDVETPTPSDARLINLSTRARSLGGDNILIPGFVVQGTGIKQLLMRAVGPRLADFGVSDALADPRMTLQRDIDGVFQPVATNDNWESAGNAQAIVARTGAVGAFALNSGSNDAALDHSATPGRYTVTADGVNGLEGVALVEVYDADGTDTDSRLSNLSIRAFAGAGDDTIIPGFVISDEGPLTLLIRAVGPTLADFGVTGALEDPKLTVFSEAGMLFENDDWGDSDGGATASSFAAQVGAFELGSGSADAALAVTLAPGQYTVQVQGSDGGTGVALFELYEVR